jgi:hypothetical protein
MSDGNSNPFDEDRLDQLIKGSVVPIAKALSAEAKPPIQPLPAAPKTAEQMIEDGEVIDIH